MGLDNGINVVIHNNVEGWNDIPMNLMRDCENAYINGDTIIFEMIYWRKWWGVRNEVVYNLHKKYNLSEDQGYYELDADDCYMIIDTLRHYNDATIWGEKGCSVWNYTEDDIEEQIDIDIYILGELIKMLENSPYYDSLKSRGAIEVKFYDSY